MRFAVTEAARAGPWRQFSVHVEQTLSSQVTSNLHETRSAQAKSPNRGSSSGDVSGSNWRSASQTVVKYLIGSERPGLIIYTTATESGARPTGHPGSPTESGFGRSRAVERRPTAASTLLMRLIIGSGRCVINRVDLRAPTRRVATPGR